ncbi:MAG TPA: hydroxymethylglutaryl-CoA synthase [Candidatus Bathyarchaeia archaeon]|nr:hydroxymethylglutaryl-CoA synthase [Candidatus Bathyarchaeia archaeon]
MKTPVGIDDISVYIPRLFLELADEDHPQEQTEFSRARSSDPAKYLQGIGIAKMSVPDNYQDSSVLAANAIYELLERNYISPSSVARIDIATETGVDESKPVAAYVHGMLEQKYGKGSLKKASGVEYKFACVSTADALESSLDWAWAGRSNGRVSIVCATDIARYPLNTPGEPTQGAGAVAFLVKENPRLLAYDTIIGTYMEDEDDFWRPLFSTTAVVQGKHSERCYLKAMEGAVDNWAEQAAAAGLVKTRPGESLLDHFGPMSFHVPYPKMAEKGFAYLLRHFWRGLSRWNEIVRSIGTEPKATGFKKREDLEKAEADYMRRFMETAKFQTEYKDKVADGLTHARESGNSYSASEKSCLSILLESKAKKGSDLAGKRGGSGNYGSGSKAKASSWVLQEEWSTVAKTFGHMEKLQHRKPISLVEYEALHESKPLPDRRKFVSEPENEFVLTDVTSQGYRHYKFAD